MQIGEGAEGEGISRKLPAEHRAGRMWGSILRPGDHDMS